MPVGIAQGYAFPADFYVQGDLPDLCCCLPCGHQGCWLEVWRIICHKFGLVPVLPVWKLPQVLHTPGGCGCWNVQDTWPCSRNVLVGTAQLGRAEGTSSISAVLEAGAAGAAAQLTSRRPATISMLESAMQDQPDPARQCRFAPETCGAVREA